MTKPILKVIDSSGKESKTISVSGTSLVSILYYEKRAMAEVKDFLGIHYKNYGEGHPSYLPRYEQLLAGEQALSFVLRFHQSARERGVRKGPAWDKVEEKNCASSCWTCCSRSWTS